MKLCFLLISSHNDKFPRGWNHPSGMCLCLNSDKHHFMVFRRLEKTKTCKCYFRVITTKKNPWPSYQNSPAPACSERWTAQVSRTAQDSQLCLVSWPGTCDVLECNCFVSEAHLCVPLPLALIYHLLYSNSTQTRPSDPTAGCEVLWVDAFSNQWH